MLSVQQQSVWHEYSIIKLLKMIKRYLSLLGLLISISVFGQQPLTGKIFDSTNNSPLAGAKITVDGTDVSSTDANGNFSIPCPENQILTISYIGFEAYSAKVENCGEFLNIGLKTSISTLDEVQLSGTLDNNKKSA